MSFPEFSPDYCPDCGSELDSKKVEGRERLFCKKCEEIVWLNPDIVAGFVVQRGDEILLQKRGIEPHKGKWSIPSGYLELEETPFEGARRELEEETGLRAEEAKFLGHLHLDHPDGSKLISAIFHTEFQDTSGDLAPEEGEVEELEFWSIEKIFAEKEKLDHADILDLIEKTK
jgi:8-oxo-dGTP diphosphatase